MPPTRPTQPTRPSQGRGRRTLGVPKGSHMNKAGNVVANMGRRKGAADTAAVPDVSPGVKPPVNPAFLPPQSNTASQGFYTPIQPYVNSSGQTPQQFQEAHGADYYNTVTPAAPYQMQMNDRRTSALERLARREEAGKNINEQRLGKLQGMARQDQQFSKFQDKLGEYDKWGQMYGGPGQTSAGSATYGWYQGLTPEQQAQVAGLMFANKGQVTGTTGGVGPGVDIFPSGGPVSMGGLLTSSFPGLSEAYRLGLPDTNWYKDPVTGEVKFDYAGELHKEKKAAGAYSPGGAAPGTEYGPPLPTQTPTPAQAPAPTPTTSFGAVGGLDSLNPMTFGNQNYQRLMQMLQGGWR